MTTSTKAHATSPSSRQALAGATFNRARNQARWITAVLAAGALALAGDLLLVGHTEGKELLGLVTAASAVVVGLLSLAGLAGRSRPRAARIVLPVLYALWAGVAVLGLIGFSSHRAPITAESVDQRPRPPLAPLVFTGLGIAGAATLRYGSKASKGA